MAPGWLLLSFGWDQDSARLPRWPTFGCVAKMAVVGSVEAKVATRLPRWLLLVASIKGKMANCATGPSVGLKMAVVVPR